MMENFDFSYAPRPGFQQRVAVTTTPANGQALSANISGTGKIRVVAVAAEVQIQFGDSNVVLVKDQTGSGTDVGWSIAAGDWQDFYLSNQTHFAVCGSGAGFVVLMRAGRERMGR
ncbi:MAG TPA: hypothetical protein VGK73_35085 [Polyangiaceae bacterium]